MILAHLKDSGRYECLHPLLKELFDYVKATDWNLVAAGRIRLRGDELFINVDETELMAPDRQRFEVHRRYLDVHIPLTASELVGWQPLEALGTQSDEPFDQTNDRAFYSVPVTHCFEARPGQFYLMFPEDAHAPIIGQGPIRKLVAKLRIGV